MQKYIHDNLPCGIEYAVCPLPARHIVSFQVRVLGGVCTEPPERLGLARIMEETLDKGTARHSGRELSDAFDAIGAGRGSGAGRETVTFTCTVLPEHFERAVELHAELLTTPTFPEEFVRVNIDLSRQELLAMQDDPQALVDREISQRAFGPILGRHALGSKETLDGMSRDDLVRFWRQNFHTGRMMVAVAGAVEPKKVVDVFEKHFGVAARGPREGRSHWPVQFTPGIQHQHKELEQEQIGVCFPGVGATHPDFPAQQVALGILSGGMSGRLFTEVREKLGLVYWVSAWQDTPRGAGMIFLGASTTPERCDKTYTTLLREVDRLADDIQQDELDRAVTGLVASQETKGDVTRSRCGELCSDLFFHGRPVPPEEKSAKVQAVTIADVKRYLATYPRDPRCVVTLGPKALAKI